MMELCLFVMNFFTKHTNIAILLVLLVMGMSLLVVYLRRFDRMYRAPRKYFMGTLSLIITVSIFLLAAPFWTVMINVNFFGYLKVSVAGLVIFVLVFWNLLATIEFFTEKRIIMKIVEYIIKRRRG